MKEEIQTTPPSFREAFQKIDSDAFVTVICLAPKTYRLMARGLGILDVRADYEAATGLWEVEPLSSSLQTAQEARMIAAFRNQEGMS